jgi:hypothetical protein
MKVIFIGFEVITEPILRQKIRTAKEKLSKLHKIHEQLEKVYVDEIENLKNKCKHWNKIYVPDASGNNDWYYECSTCDKYGKRI